MRHKRDNLAYLLHMQDAIDKLKNYIGKHSQEDFFKDEWDHDAVVRNLEIIGEAANNLSASFRDSHKEIPWRKIIDLRNIVAHDYADIDITIIWNIISSYIPELYEQIHEVISAFKK